MDIEGVEDSVIKELFQSGRLNLVRKCVMEYHHHFKPKEDSLSQTLPVRPEYDPRPDEHVRAFKHLLGKRQGPYLSIHIKNRSTLYDSWKQDC